MKIPTKARYGVRVMVDIALQKSASPVLLRDIARRQELSERYLEHVVTALRNAGLVKSIRGAKGGYLLGRDPGTISLYDIVEATIGPLDLVDCVVEPQGCPRSGHCATRDVWEELSFSLQNKLKEISLEELTEREIELQAECGTPMYYI
ncbi:MAG: Rrf2 family transcriptional regulator [Actinobacteria bacterium]|nr:Rrf2 family transcriptional regulator [Actinomycetota bacterium]